MPIQTLRISRYRSIYEMELELSQLNVVIGPNGCGKSNLYRSLELLWHAAEGTFAHALAMEGGYSSALWAGSDRNPGKLELGFVMGDYDYTLQCRRIPGAEVTAFPDDPQICSEKLLFRSGKKSIDIFDRSTICVTARNAEGTREQYVAGVRAEESVLSQMLEPQRYPHIIHVRTQLLKSRFYHEFRSDSTSPLRMPQVAARTPVMASDGRDVAAAIQTIFENGDGPGVAELVAEAFMGARVSISNEGGFQLNLHIPGLHRPMSGRELSDGTLRFLCLLAALMSPRMPPLLALNEPESSLHPDLLPTLAKLIVRASQHSQIWVTTHSQELAGAIAAYSGVDSIRLDKVNGQTVQVN